jgi:hypothetical protein
MTSANAINCVVSCLRSVPRKPLNINLSLASQGRPLGAKSLLCDMLRGTSPKELTTSSCGGGHYKKKILNRLIYVMIILIFGILSYLLGYIIGKGGY